MRLLLASLVLLTVLVLYGPTMAQEQENAHMAFPASSTSVASQFRQVTFANLGLPAANNTRYCSDCGANVTTGVCTAGGTGRYAYRQGGIWYCTVGSGGGGGGDVSSNVSLSVNGQAALFSGVTGKLITPFASTGFVKATAGVLSAQALISLVTDVTGNLPVTNLNSGTNASAGTVWCGNGTWCVPTGAGTVTSVAASVPAGFTVTGSPVTSSGTLAITYATGQTANRFLATPNGSTGALSLRAIGTADVVTGATTATRCLRLDGSSNIVVAAGDCVTSASSGTVTSVALALPAIFTVSGSPVTTSGTLTAVLATETANTHLSGPTTGAAAAPTFRALVAADIPAITEAKFSFTDITTANSTASLHGLLPKLSGNGSDCLRGDGSFSTCPGAGSGGDFSTNTVTSVAQQVVVASGTGGKTGTFALGTGVGILTAGVLTYKANPAGAFVGDTDTQTLTNKTLTQPFISDFTNATHNHTNTVGGGQLTIAAFSSVTGSGAVVGAVSPSLTTPTLGVATATSINKVTITAPTTSAVLTIANGKTLTTSNTLTFTGTDGTSFAYPSTSGTLLTADSTATVTNKSISASQVNSGVLGTARLGTGTADSSVFLRGDGTWAAGGSGSPGGSTTQFQFNNAGAFGGSTNFTFTSATGQVTANQGGNGNTIIYGKRTTDSSPSGNLIQFQNQAGSTDLFKADVNGNTTVGGTLTVNTVGGTDGIMTLSSASAGGGVQLTSGTKPTCDVTKRFLFWVVAGGAGVKDTVETCAKDVANAYAWRTIY